MQTIIVKRNGNGVSYPVGSNMKGAIELATLAAMQFNKLDEYKDLDLNVYCRGSSGAILASLFINFLQWPNETRLCYVRKDNEPSHDGNGYPINNKRVANVVIDDFICTGYTLAEIKKVMDLHEQGNVACLILEGGDNVIIEKLLNPTYFIMTEE
jgi:hypothetical protein